MSCKKIHVHTHTEKEKHILKSETIPNEGKSVEFIYNFVDNKVDVVVVVKEDIVHHHHLSSVSVSICRRVSEVSAVSRTSAKILFKVFNQRRAGVLQEALLPILCNDKKIPSLRESNVNLAQAHVPTLTPSDFDWHNFFFCMNVFCV